MHEFNLYVGVDFGSKLAGTTVICYCDEQGRLAFHESEKKRDADVFLLNHFRADMKCPAPRTAHYKDRGEMKIHQVFIDAPLSLPGVYKELVDCDNYFYRKADVELKAMSPMFLGGLTARTMKLKKQLEEIGLEVYEIYPAALARKLDLQNHNYKKGKAAIPTVVNVILELLPLKVDISEIRTWHHVDALLAYLSGYRFQQQIHEQFGCQDEGIIIV